MNLQYITNESIPRIHFISYDELIWLNGHFHYLTIDGRIIEISSQKKKNQDTANNITIENRKQKYASYDNSKYQISSFPPWKFLSIVDENAHQDRIKDKIA